MQIIDFIVAAGSLSESIQHISETEEHALLIVTKKNCFHIHILGHRIVIEAIIDTQFGAERETTLVALLNYNAVWLDSGHIRMALSGRDSDMQAMLIADVIFDQDFTAEYFADLIEDLDMKAQVWRDIIAAGADDGLEIISIKNHVRV